MSIRKCTPCDCDGICPYDAMYGHNCEYWCGADEPEDIPDVELETEWTEFVDYDEYGTPIFETVRGVPEAN